MPLLLVPLPPTPLPPTPVLLLLVPLPPVADEPPTEGEPPAPLLELLLLHDSAVIARPARPKSAAEIPHLLMFFMDICS